MATNKSIKRKQYKTNIKSGGAKVSNPKKFKILFLAAVVFLSLGVLTHRVITGGWIGANAATILNYNPYYSRCNPEIRNTTTYQEGRTDSTNLESGYCVKVIQRALNACCGQGLLEDGIFGPKTKQAVLNYQTFFKDPKPDGIVDKELWDGLDYIHSIVVKNSGQTWVSPANTWQQALAARTTTASTSSGSTSTNTTITQTPGSTTTSTGTSAGTVSGSTNTTITQTPGSTTTSTGTTLISTNVPIVPAPPAVKPLTECVRYKDAITGKIIERASPSDTYRASSSRNGCYQISDNIIKACFSGYKIIKTIAGIDCAVVTVTSLYQPSTTDSDGFYKLWAMPTYYEKEKCGFGGTSAIVGIYVLNNVSYKGYPSNYSYGCHKGSIGSDNKGNATTELVKCFSLRTPYKRTLYINGRAISDYKCIK